MSLILLVGLVLLFQVTESVFLCSFIYGIAKIVLVFFTTGSVATALMFGGIAFFLATGYFWILSQMDNGGFLWWLIMVIGGIAICLI